MIDEVLQRLGLTGTAWACPVDGSGGVGFGENDLVAPASVMKIQIALAIETLIAAGELDGAERRRLGTARRVPGSVGVSLMRDDVEMSVRDLVVAMLTISDNVATDELLAVAGLERVNATVSVLGLTETVIASDLRTQLDQLAESVGFTDFEALAAHRPERDGPPAEHEMSARLAASPALDPKIATRTTAAETVQLLKAIWTDRAGPATACASIRSAMGHQLVRTRIASGFDQGVTVAAKSGGLLGVVRNEAGVVTFPDGRAYAVAVFTRRPPTFCGDPRSIDAAIGTIARGLVQQLRAAGSRGRP